MRKYFHIIIFLAVLSVVPAKSMDFSWIVPPKGYGHILMSGEVKIGDYQRFVRFMQKHAVEYGKGRNIFLSSSGGNLVESLKIAGLLRQMYPTMNVQDARCASSCFFLYLSGSKRYAAPGAIGIHRAYFDRAYFSELDANAARIQQTKLTSLIASILEENSVPQSIREKMLSTPSTEIYWLSQEEISSLGEFPAWYEEILIAKCDLATFRRLNDLLLSDKGGSDDPDLPKKVAVAFWKTSICEDALIAPELKKFSSLVASEDNTLTEAPIKKAPGNRKP